MEVYMHLTDASWLRELGLVGEEPKTVELQDGAQVTVQDSGSYRSDEVAVVRFVLENLLTAGAVSFTASWLHSLIHRRPDKVVSVEIATADGRTSIRTSLPEEIEILIGNDLQIKLNLHKD